MIVDTSALIAILAGEASAQRLSRAIVLGHALLPAPALTEYHRVVSRRPDLDGDQAAALLSEFQGGGLRVLPFTERHAEVARQANALFGIGVAIGGTLNLLDLMVYACAKVERRPILCTGRDFRVTDAMIHAASHAD